MFAPPFSPHPLLRGAHAQTIAGSWAKLGARDRRAPEAPHASALRVVTLEDGDAIAVHDETPRGWKSGGRAVLLVHGLGGDATSPYMLRIARKLRERGARVFRMEMRGSGAGLELARYPYHSGRGADVGAAAKAIAAWCPGSPVGAAGFSLGGHLLLRWLGEAGAASHIDRAFVASPPCDLRASVEKLRSGLGAMYDRYFARALAAHAADREKRAPGAVTRTLRPPPRSIREFDERFTAPIAGFADADAYYERCASVESLRLAAVPTCVVVSRDDPVVAVDELERAPRSPQVELLVTAAGGHLGFLARRSAFCPDGRWLDAVLLRWLAPPTDHS